jgi:hypothetical protein
MSGQLTQAALPKPEGEAFVEHLVVFVPGIMGSRLRDPATKIEVWPPTPSELLRTNYADAKFQSLKKKDLDVVGLLDSVDVCLGYHYNVYGDFIAFVEKLGFLSKGASPRLAVLPYDWRHDLRTTAAKLDAAIERAIGTLPGSEVKISILAHSMGGLVARYYLESGTFDPPRNNPQAKPGFRAVRQLVTFGTPHHGAPLALTGAVGLEERNGLSTTQIRVLANTPDLPSLYQLLPPESSSFVWRDAKSGVPHAPLELYKNAAALGLADWGIKAAQDFRTGLKSTHTPLEVRYFCFVGTRLKTSWAVDVTDTGSAGLSLDSRKIDDGGDGTVPTWSAYLPGAQSLAVDGEHLDMLNDGDLRGTLALLLERHAQGAAYFAAVATTSSVRLGEKLVFAGSVVRAEVRVSSLEDTAGELRVDRVDAASRFTTVARTALPKPAQRPRFALEVVAPQPGLYRVGFFPGSPREDAKPVAEDMLFVREPHLAFK